MPATSSVQTHDGGDRYFMSSTAEQKKKDAPAAAAAPGAAPAAKSKKKSSKPKSSGRLLWQVPLLVGGLFAFGYGVRALSKAIGKEPFSGYQKDIEALIAQERYNDAITQINKVANTYGGKQEIGVLSKLSGDAYWGVTRKPEGRAKENFNRMIEHYRIAASYGVEWDITTRERVGEVAMELGDKALAVEQIEKVVKASPEALPKHARMLVRHYSMKHEDGAARDIVDRLLAEKQLDLDDRVWGICKRIEMSLGGAGSQEELDKAVEGAKAALKEIPERNPAGTLLTWIGRAEFEAGKPDAAWEHLVDARSRFIGRTDDDGRAAVLMGKIAQLRKENGLAKKLFESVIAGYPGTTLQAAARFGRAEILASEKTPTAQMEDDFKFVVAELRAGEKKDAKSRPELVTMQHVRASLQASYQAYQREQKFADALRFLALVNTTGETPEAANIYRGAFSEEKLGEELLAAARREKDEKAAAAKREEGLRHLGLAAEGYVKHAELSTMDDAVYGTSMWKGASLMDRAGRSEDALKLYEQFSIQKPRDPHTPEALYAMGLIQQALGRYDAAIATHIRNRKENPRTPPSYLSTVELARCYMAKGENFYKQAEEALLELVQDNHDLLPAAAEFREAIFALGDLYNRWSGVRNFEAMNLGAQIDKAANDDKPALEQKRDEVLTEALKFRAAAILRLDEAVSRYPADSKTPRATFLLADCYRRSAGDIAAELLRNPGAPNRAALEQARADRLTQAAALYDRVIATLERGSAGSVASTGTPEDEYLRYSHLNRAECYFDLNQYAAAVKLYDDVATRYAQSLTAVEAYVQIVRAYNAMDQGSQAKAAAERARWVLKRIPEEAFGRPPLGLSREYYEKFLAVGKE
jgi:tetratricopeptide (TPR) repeat protein